MNPTTKTLRLETVDDEPTRQAIYRFRARVWQQHEGIAPGAFPDGHWFDAHDATAMHWIARNQDNAIVASARLSLHPSLSEIVEPEQYTRYGLQADGIIAAPDRVVVCPSARRQGLAARIIEAQDAASIEAGAVCAVRQASPSMVRLVVRRQWQLLGPATTDPRFPSVQFTVAIRVFDSRSVQFDRNQIVHSKAQIA